jgi:hypothetical protein
MLDSFHDPNLPLVKFGLKPRAYDDLDSILFLRGARRSQFHGPKRPRTKPMQKILQITTVAIGLYLTFFQCGNRSQY